MQYYLTDARGVLTGGPYQITDTRKGLPSDAVVTDQSPPEPLSGEVIVHIGGGRWASAPEPAWPEVKIDITPFRLLFELMHPIEQLFLASKFRQARSLTPANMVDAEMTAETAALVKLDNAYERIDRLVNWENKGYFNIRGPEALDFLNACKSLGVFGVNDDSAWPGSEAAANTRVATIRNNQPYPQ